MIQEILAWVAFAAALLTAVESCFHQIERWRVIAQLFVAAVLFLILALTGL